VDEADEAFANVYSSAVSLQNLVPRAQQRALVLLVSVAATLGALLIDIRNYQSFLLLLGAFFVPLLGVLLAHWLLNGAHYDRRDVFESPPLRAELLVAWLAGFAVYHWIFPTGPGWWVDFVDRVRPPTGGLDAIGSSIPSFLVAFLLTAAAELAARAVSRRAAPSRT
jgi:purine-cytosine permease-like protein